MILSLAALAGGTMSSSILEDWIILPHVIVLSRSLMDSSKAAEQLSNEKAIRMVAMFDNEEVRYMHKKCCPA